MGLSGEPYTQDKDVFKLQSGEFPSKEGLCIQMSGISHVPRR